VSIELAPLSTRLLVAAKALLVYLGKMVIPSDLLPFYPYPQDVSFIALDYLVSVVLVVAVTMTSMMIAKRQQLFLSIWSYYVVTLIPVLGIVQVGNQFIADRYTYLPGLGPFLLMGLLVAWIRANVNALQRWNQPVRFVCTAVAAVVVGSLVWLTVTQIGIWKNSIDLWSYVIEKEPVRAPLAYYNRGLAYAKYGQVDRAFSDFYMTTTLDPSDHQAYYNLGLLYGAKGSFDMAIACFSAAIELRQQYDAAYVQRGAYYAKAGKKELAAADYRKACDLGNEEGCRATRRYNP
jgi:tetratricopeptide (TPR) repeat protein